MSRLLLCTCAVAVLTEPISSLDLSKEWEAYQSAYNKRYSENEASVRRNIWERNIAYINKNNLEADRGEHTFRLGMNAFGDLTTEEFAKFMNLAKLNTSAPTICGKYQTSIDDQSNDLPATVDWRKAGYVTEVINQGACGSSWAFSATAALEGQHFKKTGQLVSISASNLLDCSRPEGNEGCSGGFMDYAFEYVKKKNGIDTTASYPYKPMDGPCNFTRAGVGATVNGCMDIPTGDETVLKKVLAKVGPVATAVDAYQVSFQMYKSGVYYDKKCTAQPNHGIPVVGYGTDERDYWLLKNSWGTSWGMDGYMKIARNAGNLCGVATQASFPTM